MITLKTLDIERNHPDYLEVSWEVNPTEESLDGYVIDLYSCESPSMNLSEYTKVGENLPSDSLFFEDHSIQGLYHGTRTWYYRAKIKNPGTGEESMFPVDSYVYINDEAPNRNGVFIRNRKKLVLERKSGRDIILLKKRTWGERCDVAGDPILFSKGTEVCDTCDCWGTGWRNGFFKPIVFKGMINPTPTAKQIAVGGEFYPSDAVLGTLNTPKIVPGDIIIDPKTDKRYNAQRTRTTEILGVPLEQQVQINLIHPSDEIYWYDINSSNNETETNSVLYN